MAVSFFGHKLKIQVKEERLCCCPMVTVHAPHYCPDCGCIWVREIKSCAIDEDNLPKGFDLRRFDNEYYLVWLDSLCEVGEGAELLDLSDQEPARKALMEYLEPLGLWDEKEFGLWSAIWWY